MGLYAKNAAQRDGRHDKSYCGADGGYCETWEVIVGCEQSLQSMKICSVEIPVWRYGYGGTCFGDRTIRQALSRRALM